LYLLNIFSPKFLSFHFYYLTKSWQNKTTTKKQIKSHTHTPAIDARPLTHTHTHMAYLSQQQLVCTKMHWMSLCRCAATALPRRCYCAATAKAADTLLLLWGCFFCICKHTKTQRLTHKHTHSRIRLAAPLSLHFFQTNFFQKHTERQKGPLSARPLFPFPIRIRGDNRSARDAKTKWDESRRPPTAGAAPKCYRFIGIACLLTREPSKRESEPQMGGLNSWDCVLAIYRYFRLTVKFEFKMGNFSKRWISQI